MSGLRMLLRSIRKALAERLGGYHNYSSKILNKKKLSIRLNSINLNTVLA
jgi:hypothetical protein